MSQWKTYEANDQMPEEYRKYLLELMLFQADSEFAGAQRVMENMKYAPRAEEAHMLSQKAFEEFGHGKYIWDLCEELGVDTSQRVQALVTNPENPQGVKIINGFRKENWSQLFTQWSDVALFSVVVTPAAVAFLGQYKDSSYLPWARTSYKIYKEEQGHLGFGMWAAKRVIEFDGEKGRQDLQDAVEKFMTVGLGFFGRSAQESEHFKIYHKLGLKPRDPDDLRQEYLELLESKLTELGLELPKNVEPNFEMQLGYSNT